MVFDMTFHDAKYKVCPFMSARFNLSSSPVLNDPNKIKCLVHDCMAWVTTKTHESLPSDSALYDIQGDELPLMKKEGYCKLLEFSNPVGF
jgi:hypothetical protein